MNLNSDKIERYGGEHHFNMIISALNTGKTYQFLGLKEEALPQWKVNFYKSLSYTLRIGYDMENADEEFQLILRSSYDSEIHLCDRLNFRLHPFIDDKERLLVFTDYLKRLINQSLRRYDERREEKMFNTNYDAIFKSLKSPKYNQQPAEPPKEEFLFSADMVSE